MKQIVRRLERVLPARLQFDTSAARWPVPQNQGSREAKWCQHTIAERLLGAHRGRDGASEHSRRVSAPPPAVMKARSTIAEPSNVADT